jgi:hypothetical protein
MSCFLGVGKPLNWHVSYDLMPDNTWHTTTARVLGSAPVGYYYTVVSNGTHTATVGSGVCLTGIGVTWTQDARGDGLRPVRAQAPAPNPLSKLQILSRRRTRVIRCNAHELLMSILGDYEQREWRHYGSVRILGSEGGLYEVGIGSSIGCGGWGGEGESWQGMLYGLSLDGNPTHKLCIHASKDYPPEDRAAGLILALRHDEAAVLAKANRHQFTKYEEERVKLRRAFKAELLRVA